MSTAGLYDAIIVGGGLAGAAAACDLARAGRAVLLLEREAGAHQKVCGEFLSAEAARDLARLGLNPGRIGAERVERVRMIAGGDVAEVRLPFKAFSLSRLRLDAALLDHAQALGAEVRRGVTVRAIGAGGGERPSAMISGEEPVAAPAILLATGKHDLRGWARPGPAAGSVSISFKMHLRPSPRVARALRGCVEITLFRGGYAGLQLVETGHANLCLVLAPELYARLGRSWDAVLAHLSATSRVLASRLEDAEPLWPRPLAVARVPYGYVHSDRGNDAPGIWRLGDQAAVTPSFTGDGMAIALHSARRAAEILGAGGSSRDHHRALRRDVGIQVRRSMMLSRALLFAPAQRPLVTALRLGPGLLRAGAALTRLPQGPSSAWPGG